MPAWICLLRAVNLGAERKLPMARFRVALLQAGLANVRTYLQSGNVLLRSALRGPAVADVVRRVVAGEFGLDVPVLVRTPAELDTVVAGTPFAGPAAERQHLVRVIFLEREPDAADVRRLLAVAGDRPAWQVTGRHVYVDYGDARQVARRPAAYCTRVLNVPGTERNWRTVTALAGLCARHYST